MRRHAPARILREIGMRIGRQRIQGPPNSPGGRLMPCTMMRSAASPAGRESKFGERTWRASRSTPLEESTCKSSSTSRGLRQIICDNRTDMNGEL
jgi:hypothetical protein